MTFDQLIWHKIHLSTIFRFIHLRLKHLDYEIRKKITFFWFSNKRDAPEHTADEQWMWVVIFTLTSTLVVRIKPHARMPF